MNKSLIVLSGGQDSTTTLYWAKKRFSEVHGITFDYGQRHRVEIESAKRIAGLAKLQSHRVVDLTGYGYLGTSSLVDSTQAVTGVRDDGLPSTFVPGRNLVFLVVAAALASHLGIGDLVTGVCQTDYSGYPDCRDDTIRALESAINLGLGKDRPTHTITIHTPLMYLTKCESVLLARGLPGCWEALAHTVTCYNGLIPGCGTCPSCMLRAKGFREAGLVDPANP